MATHQMCDLLLFCYESLICYCIYSKVVCVDLTVSCVYILFDVDTAGKYFDQMSIALLPRNVLWQAADPS